MLDANVEYSYSYLNDKNINEIAINTSDKKDKIVNNNYMYENTNKVNKISKYTYNKVKINKSKSPNRVNTRNSTSPNTKISPIRSKSNVVNPKLEKYIQKQKIVRESENRNNYDQSIQFSDFRINDSVDRSQSMDHLKLPDNKNDKEYNNINKIRYSPIRTSGEKLDLSENDIRSHFMTNMKFKYEQLMNKYYDFTMKSKDSPSLER